jgi:hypothetical protein
MIDRIMGVLKLDVATFEEIEHDQSALSEAAIIVAVVALLTGIGEGIGATNFVTAFLAALVWAFVGWIIWAAVTYFVGTSLFGGQADMGEMLRVLGYAQAPRVLGILSGIPCVGLIIGVIVWVWSLAAAFIAIRQGLDIDNIKALLTVAVGWLVVFIGSFVISLIMGGAAAGISALTG